MILLAGTLLILRGSDALGSSGRLPSSNGEAVPVTPFSWDLYTCLTAFDFPSHTAEFPPAKDQRY